MGKTQKTITLALWFVVVLGLVGLVAWQQGGPRDKRAAAALTPIDMPPIFTAPAFRLIDQSGQPFGSEQLQGKVWVFRLFFSRCSGVCPGTTALFRDLDEAMPDERLQIVNVSVDPGNDTPEVLREYMSRIDAKSPQRWHLLTGEFKDVQELAGLMQLPFDAAANHSSRLMLVDGDMQVRGTYATQNGDATESLKRLVADAKVLMDRGS